MAKGRGNRHQGKRSSTVVLVLSMLLMLTVVLLMLLGLGILSLPVGSTDNSMLGGDRIKLKRLTIETSGKISEGLGERGEQWSEILSWEPRAFVYHNFLSREECEYLINLARPHMVKSTVVDSKTGKSKVFLFLLLMNLLRISKLLFAAETQFQSMAAPLLPRALPLLRRRLVLRYYHFQLINGSATQRSLCSDASASAAYSTGPGADGKTPTLAQRFSTDTPHFRKWEEEPDFRKWKDKEAEILADIEPIICLTKEILHSDRYKNGERLTPEDEKAVVNKLLAHHPHSEDKIGCGLDSIMVDQHPQFNKSRCLFVVRIDGGWIDFSYQKCLRAYIRDKYPSQAERFIKEHFRRGSG